MDDLVKKVKTIDNLLGELFVDVEQILAVEHTLDVGHTLDVEQALADNNGRHHHPRRATRRRDLIEPILESFNKISAEIGSVKCRLDALDMSVDLREDELQQEATTPASAAQRGRPQEPPVAPSNLPPIPPPRALSFDTPPSDPLSDNNSATGPVFECCYRDIEILNEAMFEKFSSEPIAKKKGYFKLIVHDLPPLKVDEASIRQPGHGHSTNSSCQLDNRGFVQLTKRPNRTIALPHFPLPEPQIISWSCRMLKRSWADTLENPPRDMTYIIGDPLFPDIKLGSGQGLEKRRGAELPGIGTTYAYLGFGESGSIMHGEDADLCSMNLLRSGATKLWLIVEPGDKEKLEHHMRREYPTMKTCAQGLRDLGRFIPPARLDIWGIRYSLDYTNPGEAICTLPKALHQVKNHDTNYAIAINVLCDTPDAIPKGYKFCDKRKCGHAETITADHLKLQERVLPTLRAKVASHQALQKTPVVQRPMTMRTRNLVRPDTPIQSQVVGSKRKINPNETRSKKPKIAPQIEDLSQVVSGAEAFHRLSALVFSWRNQGRSLEFSKDGYSAARLVRIIGLTGEKSQLLHVLSRIAKVELAEIVEKGKGDRSAAEPAALNKLMEELEWEKTQANRRRLHDYLKEGRQWKRVRGVFHGLLCLIPTPRDGVERTSHRKFYELAGIDLQQFHSLLKSNRFVKSLCQIGAIFESSISKNTEVPQFKWEGQDPETLSQLSVEKLAQFIKPVN